MHGGRLRTGRGELRRMGTLIGWTGPRPSFVTTYKSPMSPLARLFHSLAIFINQILVSIKRNIQNWSE